MKKLSLVLSLVMTTVIFLMSTFPGSSSDGMSLQIVDYLLNLIDKIIPANNISIDTMNSIVRKTAHITEYLILGVLWFVTALYWKLSILKISFIGLFTSAIDELIQLIPEGRGASIVDVLLYDFLPFLIIVNLIALIYNRKSGEVDFVVSETLAKLAKNEISSRKAYKQIYDSKRERKVPFTRRAHFVKLNITVPGEKGVNTFLKMLLFFPFPIFIIRPFLRFVKFDSDDNIPLSKTDLINMISAKGIKVVVNSQSGEKIYIKTI